MIPSTHIQIPPYSSEVSCIGAYGSDPKPPVGDAQAFARILLPLAASKPAANEIVENTTAPCQENGASMRADCHLDDENEADRQGINQEKARDQKNEKQNDNNILAAIMASCSNREKTRVYRNFERAGLPARELERLAYQLQQSAIAGSPGVSLGIALPELGEIRFDVRIKGKAVFIHAFVDNDRAAAALALSIATLRDKLEERNLVLGRLDVTAPSPGDRNREGEHGVA